MSDFSTFNRDAMRTIAQEVFREARESRDRRGQIPGIVQPFTRNSVQFRNTSGEVIPAYAVMRVTGAEMKNGLPIITVAKPSTTFQRLYLVNGPMRVGSASTARGVGTWLDDEPGFVLYDTGNTPAYGESWGPQNGTWTIKKYRYGFTIIGATTGSGATARVVAKQHEVNEVYGQTAGAIALDASGTVDLYDGNNAAIASTSISATNRFVTSVAISKKVIATWIGGTWLLSAAKCV